MIVSAWNRGVLARPLLSNVKLTATFHPGAQGRAVVQRPNQQAPIGQRELRRPLSSTSFDCASNFRHCAFVMQVRLSELPSLLILQLTLSSGFGGCWVAVV